MLGKYCLNQIIEIRDVEKIKHLYSECILYWNIFKSENNFRLYSC